MTLYLSSAHRPVETLDFGGQPSPREEIGFLIGQWAAEQMRLEVLRRAERMGYLHWKRTLRDEVDPDEILGKAEKFDYLLGVNHAADFEPSQGLERLVRGMRHGLNLVEAVAAPVQDQDAGPALLMRLKLNDTHSNDYQTLYLTVGGFRGYMDPASVGLADLDPTFYALRTAGGVEHIEAYSLEVALAPANQVPIAA